jgi:hypothetical protein
VRNDKQFKVEHGRAKGNWAHGHGVRVVVTESPLEPKIISQERLAEIKELQVESTDALERLQDIEEQRDWKIKISSG